MHEDVPNLDPTAGLEDTEHFAEHRALIGAEVDHAVADQDVGEAVIDGQRFREPFADVDVGESMALKQAGVDPKQAETKTRPDGAAF